MTHANAPFTPMGKERLAHLIVVDGWPVRRAAERFQCSPATAAKWAAHPRWRSRAGPHGPHQPAATSAICHPRRDRGDPVTTCSREQTTTEPRLPGSLAPCGGARTVVHPLPNPDRGTKWATTATPNDAVHSYRSAARRADSRPAGSGSRSIKFWQPQSHTIQ